MAEKDERFCVKFCFKLEKTATETHQMLHQAYGDAALGGTQTFEWFGKFREGRDFKTILGLVGQRHQLMITRGNWSEKSHVRQKVVFFFN